MSGRIVNVRPKPGFVMDGAGSFAPATSNVIPFRDGALANIMSGRGTSVDRSALNFWRRRFVNPEQVEQAYLGSWLHRKIVDIPAQDMTRAGRDWDAKDDEIEKIEAEEKRLGYWPKLLEAVRLGRLGGGAILIGLGDDPSQPLPTNAGAGQVRYLMVLSRWQLTLGEMDTDVLSPDFGQPRHFHLSGMSQQVTIHPSRIVCFTGLPMPAMQTTNWEDRFWGMSVVEACDEAVQQATTATSGFAALIDEAKVDVFTMPGMYETLAQPGGDAKFMAALQAAATGKSIHRMLALGEGETWETRELTWAGMPDVIKTYMGIVAGAADIPATRLLGKSPDGQNSTGESDLANYFQSIGAKQEMDLRPGMDRIDAVMLPSAGVADKSLTWQFSPLRVLTEKEEAEIEKLEADTVTAYANSGTIPESALAKAVQNRLIESQRWPGLQDAIEEAEAEGEGLPEPGDLGIVPLNGGKEADPTSAGARGSIGSEPRRRAANDGWFFADAKMKPLYVQRKLLNAAEVIAWAKAQGLETTLPAADMHATVLFSRQAVDPMKMGETWSSEPDGGMVVKAGGPRAVEMLGENAVVLLFASWGLTSRHDEMVRAGGSHDYDEYQPHVTLSYTVPEGLDLDTIKPFAGELRFGPELFEPLDLDWKSKIEEA